MVENMETKSRVDWQISGIQTFQYFTNEAWQKMKKVQDFWNPNVHWELPVLYSNPMCQAIFRAFPSKCDVLLVNWRENMHKYQFNCSTCESLIKASPIFVHVSFN